MVSPISTSPSKKSLLKAAGLLVIAVSSWIAGAARAVEPSPERGLALLLNRAYLAPAFDQATFDEVWRAWEEPTRSQAAKATKAERRRMAFHRYGLIERADDPLHRPLQYVVDDSGRWTMNCLACHQGSVAGVSIPGAANTQFALQTLTEDVRKTKLRLGKPLGTLDMGSMLFPLGTTVGSTNAVMFGVALMHYRDEDLNIHRERLPPRLTHHDHDAPAWWTTSLKKRLYCDNFAPRGHRALMQFLASKENGPEKFRAWEDDFRHIQSYIESLEPPEYPFAIDQKLAEQGREVFVRNCASCHGRYDTSSQDAYPERVIAWKTIGTDPVRLRSLTEDHRLSYEKNWINEYGEAGKVRANPAGYLAPPLNGVWASAPYFHNGSVPTLWHLLHPEQRPTVWVRPQRLTVLPVEGAANYDALRVGLLVDELTEVPLKGKSSDLRRHYFDTRKFGKSAAGHDFPSKLPENQRQWLLEYLKTL